MFYALEKDVYLVKGHARSCIYDLNQSKLYSINQLLSDKIELINQGTIKDDCLDAELKPVFDSLIKQNIITLSELAPYPHKIEELKIEKGCSFAWIEITNRCNLKCKHCYNESNAKCSSVMTLEDYKIAIDNLMTLGVNKVQVIGGEPFFEQTSLKDMLDYTIGKFQFIEIFTNGTLISQDWFNYLRNNHIHMALSVYSYDRTIHDATTGCNGSWEKTVNTIKKLKEYDIPYRVCNVLMRDVTLGAENTDLYKLSSEKDIVRMAGRASFSLLSDDLLRAKLITKETFQSPISKAFVTRLVSGHNCFKDRIYISANLEIFPCVMERRFTHGKISSKHPIILNKSICNMNKDFISGCCQCEYRYACFDCRPDSLSGETNEKPWYCAYDPISGKWKKTDDFLAELQAKWGETS